MKVHVLTRIAECFLTESIHPTLSLSLVHPERATRCSLSFCPLAHKDGKSKVACSALYKGIEEFRRSLTWSSR